MQAVLECKQCGAALQVEEDQKVVYCRYCGSANAVAYADRFGLYNRANYLRRQNEFDRAIGVYEDILKEDEHDAEAHYGIALCKYGIEYVDDPGSGKKVPTCHRTRFTLMSQDVDFRKAVEEADAETARIYREEAARVDAILKQIQQLSANQEKYDIFICYKEGDGEGGRTQTSVLAQDIYQRLEKHGYKVFFARKTLEKKLGSEYEPIIFSALFSAKVMLVAGMKPEEYQGVWVRNEWMRFRERMAGGEECTLIPLYRNMSPYELPEEFASLQALDMGRIGFEQDLLDGLSKLFRSRKSQMGHMSEGLVINNGGDGAALRKRAYLFLEQGNFKDAENYFERTLDIDPEDEEAYLGKLLLELGCRQESDLAKLMVRISDRENYRMAVRFASGELLERYQGYAEGIDARLAELKRKAEEEKEERLQREAREREEQQREEQAAKERREKWQQEQLEQRRLKKKRFWRRIRRLPFVLCAVVFLFSWCFTIKGKFYFTPSYYYDGDLKIEMGRYELKFTRLFYCNDLWHSPSCGYLYYRIGNRINITKTYRHDWLHYEKEYLLEEKRFLVRRRYKGSTFLCYLTWMGEEDWMNYTEGKISVDLGGGFYYMDDGEYYRIYVTDKKGYKYLEELQERARAEYEASHQEDY